MSDEQTTSPNQEESGPIEGAQTPGPEAPPTAPRSHMGRTVAIAVVLVVVASVALFAALFAPVPVTIEGRFAWVPRGTTVAGLGSQGRLAGTPGDLMSVKNHILRQGAGGPPTVHVNGEVATSSTLLGFNAHVTSAHGADVVEGTTTVTTETPPAVRFVGTGPVENVEESGKPGKVEMVVGALSGEEVSRRVLSSGTAMTVRREPAYKGVKEVALTFDDGPWPGSTDAILSELTSAGAKATFFEIGKQVKGRPEISRRVLAAGMEIGDHSYSHKYLGTGYSHKVITQEIQFGEDAIKSATGITPTWYRPAGGSTNAFVFSEAKRMNLRLVLWTIDPHDYQRPGVKTIARRVLNNVRPGSVILMHDGGGDRSQTVAALQLVLHGLLARGYKMVTLSRLYRLPGAKP
jgi:peptidoglycan/xylan/chitin deacetylase (PgdA/CDA1 family)